MGYAVASMGFAVGRENWLDKNWLELVRTGQAKPDSAPNCLRSPRRGLGDQSET